MGYIFPTNIAFCILLLLVHIRNCNAQFQGPGQNSQQFGQQQPQQPQPGQNGPGGQQQPQQPQGAGQNGPSGQQQQPQSMNPGQGPNQMQPTMPAMTMSSYSSSSSFQNQNGQMVTTTTTPATNAAYVQHPGQPPVQGHPQQQPQHPFPSQAGQTPQHQRPNVPWTFPGMPPPGRSNKSHNPSSLNVEIKFIPLGALLFPDLFRSLTKDEHLQHS